MTINFDQLKNNRKSNFDKLTAELNKLNNTSVPQDNTNDDRYWKPDVDKAGNGYAIIRFLPAPAGEDMPFVRIWDHGFQGPGGWYIEKSLTTLNKQDPVSEYNSKLWASGIESNKAIVRKQKRRLNYYSNILVVNDPTRPDNNGKVFLFKYGKKIFDKLNEAMHPQFADEKAVNPFDLWDGANFKLKIRQVEGYRNYDKSEFDTSGPLSDDDSELEAIWKQEHSLQEFLDEKHFKSYDELKQKLYRVLALDGGGSKPVQNVSQRSIEEDSDEEFEQMAKPAKSAKPASKPKVDAPWDEDEDLEAFKSLIND